MTVNQMGSVLTNTLRIDISIMSTKIRIESTMARLI
jgi:hypothetical protein